MEATEQTVFQPAGFWVRLFAHILDFVIVGIPLLIVSYFITGEWEGEIFTNVLSLLYYLLLPVFWYGYTVGKRIVGVRIVKVNGEKVGIGTMILRLIVASIVYGITLGIAAIVSLFMVAFRKDKRSVHDFIAGTYVTHEKPNQAE